MKHLALRVFLSVLCTLALVPASSGFAADHFVPADFPTIQAAIDAASPSDTVIVAPGLYVENLDFLGKVITVTSSDGPEVTVIEAAAPGSVVVFKTGEGRNSVLNGFTIQGGTGSCVLTGVPRTGVYGGGILVQSSSPTISDNWIIGNDLSTSCSGTRRTGGGVGVVGGKANPLIVGNRIENNHVSGGVFNYGGGVGLRTSTEAEIRGNVIADNSTFGGSEAFGGGIYCYSSSISIIEDNTIERNVADVGGGISLFECTGSITGNTIRENSTTLAGGGIRVRSSNPLIERNLIASNTSGSGGGIRVSSSNPRIERNQIVSNTSDYGGGIDISSSPLQVPILLNEIVDNTATFQGGGIRAQGRVTMVANRIQRNTADEGAGAYLIASSASQIASNIIAFNHATGLGGGVVLANNGFNLVNNTVFGNSADIAGGGIVAMNIGCGLYNSIVWDNVAPLDASIHEVESLIVEGSDVEGGHAGPLNIDIDPRLVDPYGENFRLGMGSPCIDQAPDVPRNLPDIDFEEQTRIVDGDVNGSVIPDIGADEAAPQIASLFGSVNAAVGPIADVLFVNGSAGDERRRLAIGDGQSIVASMILPPAGGNGKYIVHVNTGAPSAATVARLSGGVGWIGFDLRLNRGAMPIAIHNGIGKRAVLGDSVDFDGAPIADPAPAPSTFLSLPIGDPVHLPVGTVVTLQGGIIDPGTAGAKPASVTNGIVLEIE